MSSNPKNEEVRWRVIKAMLDEFPMLREKVKVYLTEQKPKK